MLLYDEMGDLKLPTIVCQLEVTKTVCSRYIGVNSVQQVLDALNTNRIGFIFRKLSIHKPSEVSKCFVILLEYGT